jgi:hypothetical protein
VPGGTMFWLIVLVFLAALCGGAFLWDRRTRRQGRAPGVAMPPDQRGPGEGRPPWQDVGG